MMSGLIQWGEEQKGEIWEKEKTKRHRQREQMITSGLSRSWFCVYHRISWKVSGVKSCEGTESDDVASRRRGGNTLCMMWWHDSLADVLTTLMPTMNWITTCSPSQALIVSSLIIQANGKEKEKRKEEEYQKSTLSLFVSQRKLFPSFFSHSNFFSLSFSLVTCSDFHFHTSGQREEEESQVWWQ